ncbi:ACP S-malonyltransferase [Palleronia caenipelagi]|uniref:[acyl-carrier-protein] S-malonyltransferase n=1 Tax=Palleronia caenipelagi TaxID=2489174 RepID=A0A547PM64_9RHOB|nr:ACP S-malonyltransferase [Palleronia caenipelagi]TRD15203.1 ACP S-malonyltransferase [Palleronia caenipelagi]
MTRKTAVLICPGRGTYNAPELGYLGRHHASRTELLARFDALRSETGQEPVTALDAAPKFQPALHTRGDAASPLIYACSYLDALAIDRERIDIVAVTGNSMGWYIALACAGAVSPEAGFRIVNTMGTLMQERLIGGQLVYPFVDADWQEIPGRRAGILDKMSEIAAREGHDLAVSIALGGMLVLAGNDAGLRAFEAEMPRIDDRFPMRLKNHAAFHTALQAPVATEGQACLGPDLFGAPDVPLIDGRGQIWWPGATDSAALRDYTLGHQVTEAYDFSRAIQTAAREFAPDLFIITGPGTTLGGATAQALIQADWRGMAGKTDFQTKQKATPLLVSMGLDDQRFAVTKGE